MPSQVVPVTGLDTIGLIADLPPVSTPPAAITDCRNVRFRNGSVSKMRGDLDILPHVRFANESDVLKYVIWWPNPNLAIFNQGYYLLVVEQLGGEYIYVIRVGEAGTEEEPITLMSSDTTINKNPVDESGNVIPFQAGGNWQHTFFQGGFAIVINNGLETPYFMLDREEGDFASLRFDELPGWASYAVGTEMVTSVTAGVVRAYGDNLIAGDLVERDADGEIVRALPGIVRTSDIAAPGQIPQNWNPFDTAVNTADEFVITSDGVVTDFVELQGNMYVYSNSSISVISRTGNATTPFSVRPVTSAYGALTTDSVIEFDGRHFVVGAQDMYLFGGHPGSIQSVAEDKVRRYFYDDLSLIDIEQVFVIRYQQQDEIWVCYPSQTAVGGRSDEALIWNYRNNTWTKRDIPGAFNGVLGPIPGGGLPEASFEFTGEPQGDAESAGSTHQVTINGLAPILMENSGETHESVLNFSLLPRTAPGGNPIIRFTLNNGFRTGGEADAPSLRLILQATDASGERVVHINYNLPPGLGDAPYNTFDYRQQVVLPIVGSTTDQEDVIDSKVLVRPSGEADYQNVAFEVEFQLDVINAGNLAIEAAIADLSTITSESDLSIQDRPVGENGAADNSIDEIGENIVDTDLPGAGKVFSFDFNNSFDNLDNYVFFFKGVVGSTVQGHRTYEDFPEDTMVYYPTSHVSTSDTVSGGNRDDASSGTDMDQGDADGDRRVTPQYSPGTSTQITEPLTGTRIRDLLANSDIDDLTELDLLVTQTNDDAGSTWTSLIADDVTYTASLGRWQFTFATGFVQFDSEGNELETFDSNKQYDFSFTTRQGSIDFTVDGADIVRSILVGPTLRIEVFDTDARYGDGSPPTTDLTDSASADPTQQIMTYSITEGSSLIIRDFNLIAYVIPQPSDGTPDYDTDPINGGLLTLQFSRADFDKDTNSWVAAEDLEPIPVILNYTFADGETGTAGQNAMFANSVVAALQNNPDFNATATGASASIVSTANEAYTLAIELDDLAEYTGEVDDAGVAVPGDPISATDIQRATVRDGQYPYDNNPGSALRNIVAPCIRVSHTDPNGIDFFSFTTDLIELRQPDGNNLPLPVADQIVLINNAIQAQYRSPAWLESGGQWSSFPTVYEENLGDMGVPYPGPDGRYVFPRNRQGDDFVVEFFTPGTTSTAAPTFTLDNPGEYPTATTGSYFAMNLSSGVTYLFYVGGTTSATLATTLQTEINRRVPELQVSVSGTNAINIEPAVIGENTVYIQEAYFNSDTTIDDFRRIIDPEQFTQDVNNPDIVLPLPEAVLGPIDDGFPSITGGPEFSSMSISTDFDIDRTWSASQVDFSEEFPIFAAGMTFPNGNTDNKVIASEIGWSTPVFSLTENTVTGYTSFFERKQMALSPEFETEHLFGIAMWADGETPTEFRGSVSYNVLQLNLIASNNPGQNVDLTMPTQSNTFYISEDYKMDTRLTGRFLNWRISDEIDGNLQSPGGKTFTQQAEWRVSGMQLKIRTSGGR